MSQRPKSVSVRHLHAAVKTALEATRKQHPQTHLAQPEALPALTLVYRPWLICGIPVPWPWEELGQPETVEFVKTFTSQLAGNPQIAEMGVEGKFQPAVYVSGNQASVGFVPGEANISE